MAWIWPLFWIAVALGFGCLEGYAIATGRMTLSRWTWNMTKAWPPWAFCCGLAVGFLACHFFWPGEGCAIAGFGG